jgi:hypothetical protein
MKVYWWEYLLLIIAVIYIYVLYDMYFNAPNIEKYIKGNQDISWTSYKEFLEKADNGDLILLSGDSKGERTCRWAANCVFSHVGMVFREKDVKTGESKLYIWEADVGQRSKPGPRIMVLDDKLSRYKGFKIMGWTPLMKGKRPSKESILKLVPKYHHKKIDNWMLVWLLPNYSIFNNTKKDRKTVFCGELVADSLQDLGILDRSIPAANYSPKDFHILPFKESDQKPKGLSKDFIYSQTIFIEF